MNDSLSKKLGFNSSLKGVFDVFGSNLSNSLKVATLGKVDGISKNYDDDSKYGIAEITPIPAWDDKASSKIEAYFFGSGVCSIGDIVLVVFTDKDFSKAINTQLTQNVPTTNQNLHSTQYGVIVKINHEET